MAHVELKKEEIKRVDIDNIRYSIKISIYYDNMNEKSLPIVLKFAEATYNIAGNSFHMNHECEEQLDGIAKKHGFDSYDVIEALENRNDSFEIKSVA